MDADNVILTSGFSREEKGGLTADPHLGPPEKFCEKKASCLHVHCKVGQSDKLVNITCWEDIAPYLPRQVYVDQILQELEEQSKKKGPLTAIYWDAKGSYFTLQDMNLINNIIKKIMKVKSSVADEFEILSEDETCLSEAARSLPPRGNA